MKVCGTPSQSKAYRQHPLGSPHSSASRTGCKSWGKEEERKSQGLQPKHKAHVFETTLRRCNSVTCSNATARCNWSPGISVDPPGLFLSQEQKREQPKKNLKNCQGTNVSSSPLSQAECKLDQRDAAAPCVPLCSSERSRWPYFDEGRVSIWRKAGTATVEVCRVSSEDSAGTTEQAARPSSIGRPTCSSSSARRPLVCGLLLKSA